MTVCFCRARMDILGIVLGGLERTLFLGGGNSGWRISRLVMIDGDEIGLVGSRDGYHLATLGESGSEVFESAKDEVADRSVEFQRKRLGGKGGFGEVQFVFWDFLKNFGDCAWWRLSVDERNLLLSCGISIFLFNKRERFG